MMPPPVVIVTGAGGGIGAAIVKHLVETNNRVVATDIDGPSLASVASCSSENIVAVQGDITDRELGNELVRKAHSAFGGLSALVNCSGWLRDARVQNMDADLFRKLIQVNLVGPGHIIDAVLPIFQKQNYGRIISFASRAWLGNFGSSGYSAAKGGIVGATRSLAIANGRYGVTVNSIAPGFITTPMTEAMPRNVVDRVIGAIPVGRAGTTEDVSSLVSFLLDQSSGYITGQTYLCCGGRSISEPIMRDNHDDNRVA